MKSRSFSRQIVEVDMRRTPLEHFEHCLLSCSIARADSKEQAAAGELRVEERRLIVGQFAPK